MERWSGKVVVVTGASSGIGVALMQTLARHGMTVVGLARRVEIVKKISDRYSGKIHALKCDITIEANVREVFQWVKLNLGGVDLLINNAGVFNQASISTGEPEKWKQVFDVNILGLALCTQEALKTMRKRGDNGQIININSIAGYYVFPTTSMVMYTASKHALLALTRSLRVELKQLKSKIKVTSISPGNVYTEMTTKLTKELYDGIEPPHMSPDKTLSPNDIADLVVDVISYRPNVQIEELMVESILSTSYGQ